MRTSPKQLHAASARQERPLDAFCCLLPSATSTPCGVRTGSGRAGGTCVVPADRHRRRVSDSGHRAGPARRRLLRQRVALTEAVAQPGAAVTVTFLLAVAVAAGHAVAVDHPVAPDHAVPFGHAVTLSDAIALRDTVALRHAFTFGDAVSDCHPAAVRLAVSDRVRHAEPGKHVAGDR